MDNGETIKLDGKPKPIGIPEHWPAFRQDGKYEKELTGYAHVTVSVPCRFRVMAERVEYEDEHGKPFYEEDYEYGPDDVIKQNPGVLQNLLNNYCTMVTDVKIEECKI